MTISATYLVYETVDHHNRSRWILPEFKGKFKWTTIPRDVNAPNASDLIQKINDLFSEVCAIPFVTSYDGMLGRRNVNESVTIPAEVMTRHPNIVGAHEFTITTHRPTPTAANNFLSVTRDDDNNFISPTDMPFK